MLGIEEPFDSDKSVKSDEICRGCLCKSDNLNSIFSPAVLDQDEPENVTEEPSQNHQGVELTYLNLFEDCTSIKVSKFDEKPTSLCPDCIEELVASYNFRNKCINSDKELGTLVNEVEQSDDESSFSEEVGIKTETTNLKIVAIESLIKVNENPIDDDESFMYEDHLIELEDDADENEADHFELTTENKVKLEEDDDRSIEEENLGEDGVFECRICKTNFISLTEFRSHYAVHNPERPFKCFEKKCKQCSFKTQEELEMHNFVYHTAENDSKCSYCKKECKTKRALKAHMKTHSTDRPHKCKNCDKAFIFTHHLRNHEKIHENIKKYTCSDCQKSFINKDRLALHQRIHTGKRPHKCSTCQKAFISASSLKIHYATHTAEKPFMCTHCGARFKLEVFLNTHLKRSHSEPVKMNSELSITKPKPIKPREEQKLCNLCNTKFETSLECTQHMKTHSYKYSCHICSKPFALKTKLDSHIKNVHATNLRYICGQCSAKFHRPDLLRYHYLRKHADGKLPYTCEICDRGFVTNSDYKVHKRRHYGEKPYECSLCDKRYVTTSELRQHKRSHTGEKPYVCNLCDKSITTINLLLYHIKQHNKDGNIDTERYNLEVKAIESIADEQIAEVQPVEMEND